jgi:acetoin utilization deacetylase AcuC-like enzyme
MSDSKNPIPNPETDNPPQTNEDHPFDPTRLRLSQNFAESVGVKKALLTIPVRKPGRQDFIRVHPEEAYRLETAVLELKEERETYLVAPELWPELPGEIVPKVLFTTLSRQGVLILWPIRLPGEEGRHDAWNRSALEAAKMAQTRWIRLAANMALGAYEIYEAVGDLPEPEWPEVEFEEMLRIAFRNHFIDSVDHSVVRRLRGAL